MINRLPPWFRQDIPDETVFRRIRALRDSGINTVCQAAHCPNMGRCLTRGQLTFMILGSQCTRNCRFCAVDKSKNIKVDFDYQEPLRIAKAVYSLGLKFVVITSVTRDDLFDGGASQFVRTIETVRLFCPDTKIEILVPDFQGNIESLMDVVKAGPDIIAHNLETVARLYADVRPEANYNRSLDILKKTKETDAHIITKSSLLLGMGESKDEVIDAIKDLVLVDCDILTFGQYLAPSDRHYPVKEFIGIEQFGYYRDVALRLGIKSVLSGPLVRSSYQAEELYTELIQS